MKIIIWTLTIFIFSITLSAQKLDNVGLPYYEITDTPETYTPENVAARMIDGLGFRYYWATEGLRPEDLSFKPSEEARSAEETVDHILGLSNTIVNSIRQVPNIRGNQIDQPTDFEGKRKKTLENLLEASEKLKSGNVKLDNCKIIFQNGDSKSEFPFWNQINGPISDALWHSGQLVSFRRSSGNPYNSKAGVLTGKVRE